MTRVSFAVPLVLLLCAADASAQERCVAAAYRLPESIGEEMRPYLVCGLLEGRDGHFTVRLNGQGVSMRGGGAGSCDQIRQATLEAADRRLGASLGDAIVRRAFVLAEFDKADRFLRAAARSEDLGIGEDVATAPCRVIDAQDR